MIGIDQPKMQLLVCRTCQLEIFPDNCLRGYGNNKQYCGCVRVQRPMPTHSEQRLGLLKAKTALWFDHPNPITKHEREIEFQAVKARLIIELGLEESDGR
jgi:hypothetical protein